MELVVIVLDREEYLRKILSILVESEISGATILNSESIEHFLGYEVPIFAGLRQMTGRKKSMNKAILAVVEEKDFLLQFRKLLEKEAIDFTQPGTGTIFTIPLKEILKSAEEIF